MKLQKTILFVAIFIIAFFVYQIPVISQFPSWPLVTGSYQNSNLPADKKPAQVIHWTSNNTITTITAAQSNRSAPAAPGYDNCGNMEFYVLHNGNTNDNNLFIYKPDGTLLYPATNTPGTGLNASFADDEIQVIAVPGTTDKWYIIYNLNIPNDRYTPSNVAYSIFKKNPDGTGTVETNQKDIPLNSLGYRYNKGKALSKLHTDKHYLYLCRRTNSGTDQNIIYIDKYELNSSGTNLVMSSNPISDTWWALTTVGSPLELNRNETLLAMLSRKQDPMDLYFFNPNTLQYSEIPINDLVIENNKKVSELWGANDYPWLIHFAKKMQSIEFSPNGNYLYMSGGGYSQQNYTNLTYLVQIEIPSSIPLPTSPLNAKVHTQEIAGWNNTNYAVQYNASLGIQDPAYYTRKMLGQLQSCINGNIYFTKTNSDKLYVIPNPNDPFPSNHIDPYDIDFGNSAKPNITFDGYVFMMPDQIDGYNYLSNSIVTISAPSSVSTGSTTQLIGTPSGGTWTSTPAGAINSSGIFTPSSAGTYTIFYTVNLPPLCVNQVDIIVTQSEGRDTICGRKYLDDNCNGRIDPEDIGLSGWTIELIQGSTVIMTTTDANGYYCFYNVSPGNYTVREVQQSGFNPSNPTNGEHNITFEHSIYGLNFLNCKGNTPTGCCDRFDILTIEKPEGYAIYNSYERDGYVYIQGIMKVSPTPLIRASATIVHAWQEKPKVTPKDIFSYFCKVKTSGNWTPPITNANIDVLPLSSETFEKVPKYFSHELVWGEYNNTSVYTSFASGIPFFAKIRVPKYKSLDRIHLTVRFEFTDTNCCTCDTLVEYVIKRKFAIPYPKPKIDLQINDDEVPDYVLNITGEKQARLSIPNYSVEGDENEIVIQSVRIHSPGKNCIVSSTNLETGEKGNPWKNQEVCDGVDNDCDGTVDEWLHFDLEFQESIGKEDFFLAFEYDAKFINSSDSIVITVLDTVIANRPRSENDLVRVDSVMKDVFTVALSLINSNLAKDSITQLKISSKNPDGTLVVLTGGDILYKTVTLGVGEFDTNTVLYPIPSNLLIPSRLEPGKNPIPFYLTLKKNGQRSVTLDFQTYNEKGEMVTKGEFQIDVPYTSVYDDNIEFDREIILYDCSPNPASNNISFTFKNNNDNQRVSLIITDVKGNIVDKVLSDYLPINGYNVVMYDASKLPQGAYYYTIISGNDNDTKLLNIVR